LYISIKVDAPFYSQTVFAYDGGQVALEFDKTGSGSIAAGDLSHRYLWGDAVDQQTRRSVSCQRLSLASHNRRCRICVTYTKRPAQKTVRI
jgi:hypothetical protein